MVIAHENVAGEVILGKPGPASKECVLIGFAGLRRPVLGIWDRNEGIMHQGNPARVSNESPIPR